MASVKLLCSLGRGTALANHMVPCSFRSRPRSLSPLLAHAFWPLFQPYLEAALILASRTSRRRSSGVVVRLRLERLLEGGGVVRLTVAAIPVAVEEDDLGGVAWYLGAVARLAVLPFSQLFWTRRPAT